MYNEIMKEIESYFHQEMKRRQSLTETESVLPSPEESLKAIEELERQFLLEVKYLGYANG